jgi:hypothetical protein
MLHHMQEGASPSTLRTSPEQLWEWAKNAHEQGSSTSDLLIAIYGADLPLEAHIFFRSWPRDNDLPIDRFFHPWAVLALGTSRAADLELDEHYEAMESQEVASNPDFIPLMSLQAGETDYDGHIIGYSLSHLRNGDFSIFGHAEDATHLKLLGSSLLQVLHAWMSEHHRMEKSQFEAPENRRTASDRSFKSAAQWLKEIDKLQHKLAERAAPQ